MDPAPRDVAVWRSWRVWAISLLVWSIPAVLLATQQYAELRGSGKQLTWLAAFAWQGASWVLLVPGSVALYALLRRRPVSRERPGELAWHVAAAIGFGCVFWLAGVPVSVSVHPSPVRWTFFGEALYKSAPWMIGVGFVAYWLVVVVCSLLETRGRLRIALEDDDRISGSRGKRLAFPTPSGTLHISTEEIAWAESVAGGARLYTDGGEALVRVGVGELEELLSGEGFVRTHRACIVNVHRVREVIGGKGRDGRVHLVDGGVVPVARRRREALDMALATLTNGVGIRAARD